LGLKIERIILALAIGAFALAAALAGPGSARADHYACHPPAAGWGFDTYEYEDYVGKYNTAIDLAVRGWAVPGAYAVGDETVNVSYQGVETGSRAARTVASPANGIPPTVYKAIAHIEADWSNAASQVPYGGVGPTLLSMDCGYGIGQITSGMGHLGGGALEPGVAAARQAVIGTHPLFNIAEGVRILADKWNSAPNYRPIAGVGDPAAIEDWYYAIWSYNGFAFVNHPLNPTKDPLRGSVWNCGDPHAPGYGVFNRGDYTYVEDVYGCVRFPPMPKGVPYPPPLAGNGTAPPLPPNPGGAKFAAGDEVVVFGTGSGLNIRPVPAGDPPLTVVPDGTHLTILGGPQTANGLTWWNVQLGAISGWAAEQYLSAPQAEPAPDAPVNPAGRMWPPQAFAMPNLASPEVASAFTVAAFSTCEDAGFAGGCPLMDFPTTPHYDSSLPPNPSDAAYFLGAPVLQIVGETNVKLSAGATSASSSPLTIKNLGSALAPFRIRTSAGWLVVKHPVESRRLDGGIAIGANYQVVDQKSPRIATAGRDSSLIITVDPTYLTAGTHTGTVTIDSLLGPATKTVFTVTVVSTGGSGGTGAGSGSPSPVPQPTPYYRAIVPNLTADQ
jgi:hypothetical protein